MYFIIKILKNGLPVQYSSKKMVFLEKFDQFSTLKNDYENQTVTLFREKNAYFH